MNCRDLQSVEKYSWFSHRSLSKLRNRGMIELGFDEDDVVLDVGCGTGVPSKEIASMVKYVIAFDASPAMIDGAKTLNAADNIDYHVADAHSFDDHLDEWKHSSFDKIISFAVFNWCSDPKKILENMKSCLKPGGRILLVFALQSRALSLKCSYGETVDSWLRRHDKWGPFVKNYVHFQKDWENEAEFLELVRSAGFEVLKSAAEEYNLYVECADEAKAGMQTIMGHISAIPVNLQDECVGDVLRWLHDVTMKQPDAKKEQTGTGESRILTLVARHTQGM